MRENVRESLKEITNYYNTYDEADDYTFVAYRDGQGSQGREQNELQMILGQQICDLGNAMMADGDIIKGAQVIVDPETGHVQCTEGRIFMCGNIWKVPAAEFDIPVSGTVAVGLRLLFSKVSELEDPGLRNPARGNRAEGLPGAWRLKEWAEWGHSADGRDGDFYPVYTIIDGVLESREAPPALDNVNQAIARYDRDSTGTGTYVVSGLGVMAGADLVDGRQVYHLAEGRARVSGTGVNLPTSRRIIYNALPDLRNISMEVVDATAASTGEAGQRVDVAHPPLKEVASLRITVEETFEIIHGSYQGCTDTLPVTGLMAILEVRQGETVYDVDTDYVRKGDGIDWSPLGNEPASGSTLHVKCRHLKDIQPEEQDLDGFIVRGAVAGTQIMYGYSQMLPRYDRLIMDPSGVTTWLQGIPAEQNPRQPVVPTGFLLLATIFQNWRLPRQVAIDAPFTISFEEMASMRESIALLKEEVARNRLEMDINTREAGAKVGWLVDPLADDSMRDQGIAQTAAIVGGVLTLAIENARSGMFDLSNAQALPYNVKSIIEQTLRTEDIQVNPYLSFAPLPAKAELVPAVDQWTETDTTWASAVTKEFISYNANYHYAIGSGMGPSRLLANTISTEVVSSSTTDLQYLRQIPIEFEINGFGPGEPLQFVTFDGLTVEITPAAGFELNSNGKILADPTGRIRGSFTIPEKVPAGSKEVIFNGGGGDIATAVFVGQGQLTVETLQQVTHINREYYDPVAQTFALTRDAQIAGVDLWFTAKDTEVRVQIRQVENGVPTRTVLAEAVLQPENIVVTGGGHTRILFPAPVTLTRDAEYAVVVLCNDATTRVSVARMQGYDQFAQVRVGSQPYATGVLLTSSNASSWTTHQDMDLAFRLLEPEYTAESREVSLGKTELSGATDLLLYAVAEIPAASAVVDYLLKLPDGSEITVAQGQSVTVAEPLSGEAEVIARLRGTNDALGPILWPGAQLLSGNVLAEGTYYSRSITATGASRASLVFDAMLPSGASVSPEIQVDEGEWQAMTQEGTVMGDNGWVEFRYGLAISDAVRVKVRLTLRGKSTARPYVANIRLLAAG